MAEGSSSVDFSAEDRIAEASEANRKASRKKEKHRKKNVKRKKKKDALNQTDPSPIHGADYEARSITYRFTDECLLQRIEQLFLCFQKDSDRIVKLMDAMFEDGTQPFNEGNVRLLSSIWPAISSCITELGEFVMRFKSSCRDETVSTAFPSEERRQSHHRSVLAGESSLSKTHDHSLKLIRKYIESIQEEYTHVEDYLSTLGPFGLIEEYDYLSFNRVSCYRRCLLFCLGMFHELREALDPYYHPLLSLESASVNAISSFKRMNEKIIESNDKGRFVCVTDGFVIYCLDLKQSKDESKKYASGFNVLPKISTINLLESGLPVSMGLFKWRGDAYMVGGQEFPGFEDHPELKFPHGLYWKYGFKGTSRKIHRLCLGHRGLRLSQGNTILPLLREPKFWPIVEIIGDHIYVMDSVPDAHGFEAPKSIPFIEVLNLNDPGRGWIKLPPIYDGTFSYPFYIKNHLVIGDRIHADSHCGLRFVLDCEKNEWKLHGSVVDKRFHVTELIGFENAKCIGQLKTGSEDDHIYVVLAIGNQISRKVPKYEDYLVVKAEAHLVSLNGYVIYTLELSHFFKGFLEGGEKRWRVLRSSYSSTVEEEENSMCVVALMRDIETKLDHLYISTFTYQFLPSWDRAQFQDGDEGFVTVVVKERHMYQVGLDLRGGGDLYHPAPRISACFL